jgi:heat shock protein HslJ
MSERPKLGRSVRIDGEAPGRAGLVGIRKSTTIAKRGRFGREAAKALCMESATLKAPTACVMLSYSGRSLVEVRFLSSVIGLGICLMAAGCDKETIPAGPDSLADQSFASTLVTVSGEARPLASKQPIEVGFPRRKGEMSITWDAGCNSFGARLQVRQPRLLIDRIAGTEMLCDPALMDQEELIVEFFDSDPAWKLSGVRLSLSNDNTEIELSEVVE